MLYYLIPILLCLFLIGVPVAYCLFLSVILSLLATSPIPLVVVSQKIFCAVDSFPLIALPLFILTGLLMNAAGITNRIFKFAQCMVGFIPGGLAHVNVLASMIFAGMSGAAVADAAGLGSVEIKAMKEQGYQPAFAAAVTAASSTIGPIIPPSIPLIFYGAIASVSIGKLLMAGLFPGIFLGLSMMVAIYIIAKKRKFEHSKFPPIKETLSATKGAILPLMTPLIIVGGILYGIFTPTEAAAVAACYAAFLGVCVYRKLTVDKLLNVFLDTALSTAVIMFIIAAASPFGWVLTVEKVPTIITAFMETSLSTNFTRMLALLGFLLFLGLFMESIAALVLVTPIVVPAMAPLGFDPVHLGVVIVLTLMIGLITPPFAICLYVVTDIAKAEFRKVVREILPFYIPIIIVLLVIAFIEEITLFLPNLLMG